MYLFPTSDEGRETPALLVAYMLENMSAVLTSNLR
jgi:hypothetical protein